MNETESSAVVAGLATFCDSAYAFLRDGDDSCPPDRSAVLEHLTRVRRLLAELTPSAQRTYLRSVHLAADLFDKFGDDKSAESVLDLGRSASGVIAAGDSNSLREELLWIRWAESVNLHRRVSADAALAVTGDLLRDVANTGVSVEFLARLHYAHARHLQKAGRLLEADESFATALQHGENLASEVGARSDAGTLRYAHLLISLILVQLARLAIDRSELDRAWRLLCVAGALQAGVQDRINRAFVRFEKGCVLRQLQHLDEAIDVLTDAAAVFRNEQHHRYLMRCQYELAKAYLNRAELPGANKDEDLASATTWLTQLDQTRGAPSALHRGDQRLQDRFAVKCETLRARIAHRRGHLEASLMAIELAFAILEKKLAGASEDLLVLATWVKGNVLLDLQRPADAIAICLEWIRRRNPSRPVDATDDSWVELVLWKAHLLSNDLKNAERAAHGWAEKWSALQNVYVKNYEASVRALHEQRFAPVFMIDTSARADEKSVWDWRSRRDELQLFLLRQVMLHHPGEKPSEWGARLGLSRERVRQLLRPNDGGPGRGTKGRSPTAPKP